MNNIKLHRKYVNTVHDKKKLFVKIQDKCMHISAFKSVVYAGQSGPQSSTVAPGHSTMTWAGALG